MHIFRKYASHSRSRSIVRAQQSVALPTAVKAGLERTEPCDEQCKLFEINISTVHFVCYFSIPNVTVFGQSFSSKQQQPLDIYLINGTKIFQEKVRLIHPLQRRDDIKNACENQRGFGRHEKKSFLLQNISTLCKITGQCIIWLFKIFL